MKRAVAALATVSVGLLALALGPSPAGAACAAEVSVDDAMASVSARGGPVFVGTVVWTTNGGEWATFAVEEVWVGDVVDEVEVRGGPQHDTGGGKFRSVSDTRSFSPGIRYLVFPNVSPGGNWPLDFAEAGGLSDNGCSATREWTDDFAASRPADAKVVARDQPIEILGELPGPFVDEPDEGPPWPWIGAISIFVVVVGTGGLLAWRAGRDDDPVDDAEIEGLIDQDRHRAGLT